MAAVVARLGGGLYNFANCLEELDKHPEALPLWERLVEADKRVHGPDHEKTVRHSRRLERCRARVNN